MKQQCLSNDFVTINDEMRMFASGLYAKPKEGEKSYIVERQREREKVCVWQNIRERGNSIGTKDNILSGHEKR